MGQLKLFPIRLIGVGTADVESFAAYLWRLAEAHQVTLGRLIRSVLNGSALEPAPGSAHKAGATITDPINYLVRPAESTRNAVDAYVEATGQPNLRAGTFLALCGGRANVNGDYTDREQGLQRIVNSASARS